MLALTSLPLPTGGPQPNFRFAQVAHSLKANASLGVPGRFSGEELSFQQVELRQMGIHVQSRADSCLTAHTELTENGFQT